MIDRKSIDSAKWTFNKGIAQLISNQKVLITIKFGNRVSEVQLDNRILQIRKNGFWCSKITITEGQNILLHQESINIWKSLSEVRIGANKYTAKQKMLFRYSATYRNAQGFEVLSYNMDPWKWKSSFAFKIKDPHILTNDIPLLLILGCYTMRRMKQEGEMVAIASAVPFAGS